MTYGSVLFECPSRIWPYDNSRSLKLKFELCYLHLCFSLTWIQHEVNRQDLISQCVCVCFQPYFRSSRASGWGCDSEGASRLPPHSPIPPMCLGSLHLYTLQPPPEARSQSFGSSRSQREKLPWPLPPLDQRLQCCSLWYWQLFYGQSKEPRRLENMCLITHLAPVCVCVKVWDCWCAARDSCWQCAISVCLSIRLCCVKRIFFQINVGHLGSS